MINKLLEQIETTGADAYSYLPYIFATIFCKKKGESPADYKKIMKKYNINLDFSTPLPENIENILINNNYQFEQNISDMYEDIISRKKTKNGQYFTPSCLSSLCFQIIQQEHPNISKIYDPTCGAGNMLAHTIAEAYFGQELNGLTAELCKMNLILEGKNNFSIIKGDTLKEPAFLDEKFDAIIGNPPFSLKYNQKEFYDDKRIPSKELLPPNGNSDLFFLYHSLYLLDENGIAVLIMYPGTLYRSKSEQKIRKNLIDNNYIDTIISTPPNMFANTSISTCIYILKKNKKDNKVLFIDASKEFTTEGKINIIKPEKILDIIKNKSETGISRLVNKEEIEKNKYMLTLNNYIVAKNTQPTLEEFRKITSEDIFGTIGKLLKGDNESEILQNAILEIRKRRRKTEKELDKLVNEINELIINRKKKKDNSSQLSLF